MTPVTTGAISLSAATLAPYVQWLAFHGPQPADAAMLISAVLITAGHAVYAFVKWKWFTPKENVHA
jgi:hypothetical protein